MRDSLRGDAPSAYPRECDTHAGSQGGSAQRPTRGRGQDVDLPTGHRRYAARPVARKRAPTRGASLPSDFPASYQRSTPEGCLFHSPAVEARSAEDPGFRISLFPGSLGLRPSDHRATKDAPLRGALSASPFRRILVRHPRGVAGLFCDT